MGSYILVCANLLGGAKQSLFPTIVVDKAEKFTIPSLPFHHAPRPTPHPATGTAAGLLGWLVQLAAGLS